jgi:hypothetical protein
MARIMEREKHPLQGYGKLKQPANAKQRLCKHVPTATNTLATMEKLLENKHNRKIMESVFYAVRAEAI